MAKNPQKPDELNWYRICDSNGTDYTTDSWNEVIEVVDGWTPYCYMAWYEAPDGAPEPDPDRFPAIRLFVTGPPVVDEGDIDRLNELIALWEQEIEAAGWYRLGVRVSRISELDAHSRSN